MTTPSFPTPSTGRRVVEDALQAWLRDAAGLGASNTLWADMEIARPALPIGTLSWLSTEPIGQDVVDIEDLGPPQPGIPDVRLWSTGLRRCVISVQVFADPRAAPEASALHRLETAIAKLALPTIRDALNAAGFGLISTTGPRRVAPGQVSAEIVGHVASGVFEDITSIQTITLVPKPELDFLPAFAAPDEGAAGLSTAFFGATSTTVDTEAEVLALLTSTPIVALPQSVAFSAGAGAFSWAVIPSALGVTTFSIDGFVGGFFVTGTVTVNGTPCDVWRSFAAGSGTFTAEIS